MPTTPFRWLRLGSDPCRFSGLSLESGDDDCQAETNSDINRVIGLSLVHDVGEIDTSNTLVFLEGGREERKPAEVAAFKADLCPSRTSLSENTSVFNGIVCELQSLATRTGASTKTISRRVGLRRERAQIRSISLSYI
jgi:hypothetical protein